MSWDPPDSVKGGYTCVMGSSGQCEGGLYLCHGILRTVAYLHCGIGVLWDPPDSVRGMYT